VAAAGYLSGAPCVAQVTIPPIFDFLWVRQAAATSDLTINAVVIDGDGSLLSTGDFSGTVTFDPGPGSFTLTATGARHTFIGGQDREGRYLWVKRLGGNGGTWTGMGVSIAILHDRSILVGGRFAGTTDFDPGPGVLPLTAVGGYDAFVVRLNGYGDLLW